MKLFLCHGMKAACAAGFAGVTLHTVLQESGLFHLMEASGAESASSAPEGVAECPTSALSEAPGSLPPGASSTAPDPLVTAHFSTPRALPGGGADEQELCLLSNTSEPVVRPAAPREAAAGEAVSCRQLGQPGEAAAKDTEAAAKGTGDCGH